MVNGGRKVLMVTAERGRVKILWVSTESRLIRIRRTETNARLTRPTIPFLHDSLRIANKESKINRQENVPKGQGSQPIAAKAGAKAITRRRTYLPSTYLPSATETLYEAARAQDSLDLFRRLRTGKPDSMVK
jgi:hypothetical protein